MADSRAETIKKMKLAQGYTEKKPAVVKAGNEANPIVTEAVKRSNREVAAMSPAIEQEKIKKDYAIESPVQPQKRVGDLEDDPRFIFGGTGLNGGYQIEGPRMVQRGGKTLLTNVSAGRLSNQFNSDLMQTPLQQELYRREGGFVTNNGTGASRHIGGQPIDPAKIKMLENIGMVKKGNMNKMNAPALSQAASATKNPIAPSVRLSSPIIYNGQEEGTGPKHIRVGAPSKGGFFESLALQSSAIRKNKERIASDKFDRKQALAEDLGRSEMAYRQKRTDMYDDIAMAGILEKQSKTDRTKGLTALDPIKVNAQAIRDTGRGNYYNSFADKLSAEAAEVAADHAIERDLNAAKAGNYEALMKLNDEKANAVPIRLQADVQNVLAQAGLRQAQTGLTNAQTNEVAANAQVDRTVKTARANAYVKDIAGKYNLNEARAREIINSEPYQTLLMQQRALQAQASAGNQQAAAELKQVEIEMSRMFMQQ